MSRSPILFSSDDEDEGPIQEAAVLKKFQTMLQGVPPPTSVTMSKLSVAEMLQKYKENESVFSVGSQECKVSQRLSTRKSTPLVYYSNSSQTSEEIANLFQKIQSRYICSETMSSCNIWFDATVKTNSAKKRSGHRSGFGLSPGSRLSHLARRRQIFSCENLQQLANSDRRRHIEIRKDSALKSRVVEKNNPGELGKTNSFKRALFLSPDEEDRNKLNFSSKTIKRNLFPNSGKTSEGSSNGIEGSRHLNLNHMGGSSKKRKRMESKDFNGHWPRRALTFTEEDSKKCQEANMRNAKVISELQLSLHHKSKLLWAVSVTLKEKNMSSKDPQFKTCASALFMICRKNLGKILNSRKEGGTSEKMLQFAREQIGGIFKKLGISGNCNTEKAPGVEDSANSPLFSDRDSSEHTKDNSDCSRVSSSAKERERSFSSNNSPVNIHSGEINAKINEKENIDVTENNNSYC